MQFESILRTDYGVWRFGRSAVTARIAAVGAVAVASARLRQSNEMLHHPHTGQVFFSYDSLPLAHVTVTAKPLRNHVLDSSQNEGPWPLLASCRCSPGVLLCWIAGAL